MTLSSRVGRATLSSSAPASTVSLLVATLTLFVAISAGGAVAGSGSAVVSQPTQELAILLASHTAMTTPGGVPLVRVSALRPITGEGTVLPVIGHRSLGGAAWLQVRLPGRPNGQTGWITRRGTSPTRTGWHIVVEISKRRVTAFFDGHPRRVFAAIVGKPSTPTPTGEFFVEEVVQLGGRDAGAPFAFALSARSDVLQEFDGGPGQIALHGIDNIGGVLGTDVSHGCVRLGTDTARWLAARIGPGFPVTITR